MKYVAPDYRVYLKDNFLEAKEKYKKFSYEFLARKIKLSKSQLIKIFDKKAHLAFAKLPLICKALELSVNETLFCHFLYLTETSEDAEIKNYFNATAHRFSRFKANLTSTNEDGSMPIYDPSKDLSLLSEIIEKVQTVEGATAAMNLIRDRLVFPVYDSDFFQALEVMKRKQGKTLLAPIQDNLLNLQQVAQNLKTVTRWIEDHISFHNPDSPQNVMNFTQDCFAIAIPNDKPPELEKLIIEFGNSLQKYEQQHVKDAKSVVFIMNTAVVVTKKTSKKTS